MYIDIFYQIAINYKINHLEYLIANVNKKYKDGHEFTMIKIEA